MKNEELNMRNVNGKRLSHCHTLYRAGWFHFSFFILRSSFFGQAVRAWGESIILLGRVAPYSYINGVAPMRGCLPHRFGPWFREFRDSILHVGVPLA
jgi:hypothetical protein